MMISMMAMIRAREVSFTRVMISLDMGGTMRLTICSKGDLEEDLPPGQAQHLAGLPLARRDALDAAPVDHGEIAGVVDDKGHSRRQAAIPVAAPRMLLPNHMPGP